MPAWRLQMRKIRQVLQLSYELGLSHREIALRTLRQQGPESNVLTENWGGPFDVATGVPFLVAISSPLPLMGGDCSAAS